MSASSSKVTEEAVEQFRAITSADDSIARSLLSACSGNVEMAVNMHMEGIAVGEPDKADSAAASDKAAGGDDEDEDGVRAPIPQKPAETLVGAGYEGYELNVRRGTNPHRARVRTVFDGFRNFGAEGAAAASSSGASANLPVSAGKKRSLEELFKPPVDITFKGDWQAARDAAEAGKKWLLVNVQDSREFACQMLNRDVWSSEAVKTILREHFVFWQQYQESDEAQRYMTFYPVSAWPHIAVVDPRTGEQIVRWDKLDDPSCFCDLVAEFLSRNGSLDKEEAPVRAPAAKRSKKGEILDAGEDEQLAAAIRASLAEGQPKKEGGTDEGDSEYSLEFSGDESAPQTPAKKQSNRSSRAVTPEKSKNAPVASKSNGCGGGAAEKPNGSNNKSQGEDQVLRKTIKWADGRTLGEDDEDWSKYLGSDDEEKSSIVIRFPDGTRESKELPCSSKFKAIIKYVACKGFPLNNYEIVTNFPRRILTDLDDTKSLKELQLFPRETVFVQQRS